MVKMQADDPPYLSVGTAVSAKYKGAFCEAKVSKVVRIVKCKVTYKMGLGNATVSDEQIKGTLRVGQLVQAKHSEKKEFIEATITKIQDCSQYTVVFDDGDITTLRRTALCLKSGRHFNESETLDQLPLTHPEHFGNPVVVGRRGRRNRLLKEDSSDGEIEEENEPDLEGYSVDIGRVVSVEATDKKRNKDNWFPGLVVIPSAQPTVRINVKDEYLVRSFKDGRYYTVPKKEVSDFNRDVGDKVESSVLSEAVQKALKYLDDDELPVHWERSSLFNSQSADSDSDENFSDSSDDKPCEEKDRFVAQLYKFMDDAGTPLNKTPIIAGKDIDLHRLFREVQKQGGYNRVTNQNKWRSITNRLKLPNTQNTFNQVKSVYKRCLLSYESFNRTLGVTMLNHTRSTKKNRGRSLIRDKDRATPVSSPRPEKEDEIVEKKEEPKTSQIPEDVKVKRKIEFKKEEKKMKEVEEGGDTSSGDTTDQSENVTTKDTRRPKRLESKLGKNPKTPLGEKVKGIIEKFEEHTKKEQEKGQQTRSKSNTSIKPKETLPVPEKKPELKPANKEPPKEKALQLKQNKKMVVEEDKKRGRKRNANEEKPSTADNHSTDAPSAPKSPKINIGDKLKVYYGPTHESKVTYEAKVIEIGEEQGDIVYRVHYTGWNNRYDEWITPIRIAENLSATTKAKRLKQSANLNTNLTKASPSSSSKIPAKRGRGMSVTGKSSSNAEVPRSTTPSSVTSSCSRTKSPATPATRSTSRLHTRQDSTRRTRRTSAHTDNSNHSDDSDSNISESESEISRTRSGGNKLEDVEIKTYKRKTNKPLSPTKLEKRKEKDDEDTEKEEEMEQLQKRTRKIKKSPEKSTEESEDETNPPKGRDFDLNQIKSELKGFSKALKVVPIDVLEKDALSEDSNNLPNLPSENVDDIKEEKPLEKCSSSEDIYEFKEPEPFEFETRSKLVDDKSLKKRLVPRIFEEIDKTFKKVIKSPSKSDIKEGSDIEKKRIRNNCSTPTKKIEDIEDDVDSPRRDEDPFDKLVESPSFNIVKTSTDPKVVDKKSTAVKNLVEEEPKLFSDILVEETDDFTRDMELSDCESNIPNIFSRSDEIFSDTFSKTSPDRNTLDLEFSNKVDECKKDSDDDDILQAQIQRAIAQSSDEDSNDALLITPPTTSYPVKRKDLGNKPLASIIGISVCHLEEVQNDEVEEKLEKVELQDEQNVSRGPSPMELEPESESSPVIETSIFTPTNKHISPALQETDSSILESMVSQKILLPASVDVESSNLGLKTGTKIADTILQKLNSIKNQNEEKLPKQERGVKVDVCEDTNADTKFDLPEDCLETKSNEVISNIIEIETKISPDTTLKTSPISNIENENDVKKRKLLSRPYIEESDSESSDSEQLIIARSDDDSQSISFDIKNEIKKSDSNHSSSQIPTTDDSLSQEEERNFKFDDLPKEIITDEVKEEVFQIVHDKIEESLPAESDTVKEEEPDSHLHSMLLCEETIPRSPAPVTESQILPETKPNKSVLEMPFASAPSTSSNNKNLIVEHKNVAPKIQPPPFVVPLDRENRPDVSAVLDNTPPTTPESTISNMSPRGENDQPNTVDLDDKSNEAEPEYSMQGQSSLCKVSPYSEEDTLMNSEPMLSKKNKDEVMPASCKRRRKSYKGSEDLPAKRGRRPINRFRHNSDSDDTSEHSNTGSSNITSYERSSRSPRPSKYNFFVEFDPSLDSGQRIAVLQQKLTELRKTYADVKSELAAVERRRKKIKRREREARKSAKPEVACV